MSNPQVTAFFDEATFTVTYVVADPETKGAAIIDPVLDFEPASGRTSTASADKLVDFVANHGLTVDWILETHVHADHLSAAPYLQDKLGGKTAIGGKVTAVQETFKGVFNIEDLATDGRQFDRLFEHGDEFRVGSIAGTIIGTPGHTPACITYVIGDVAGSQESPAYAILNMSPRIQEIESRPGRTVQERMVDDPGQGDREAVVWDGEWRITYEVFRDLGIAFAVVGALIIGSAIRIALYARREEIFVMRLVGARDSFVRRPFLIEGALTGLLGGVLATVLTYAAYAVVYADGGYRLYFGDDLGGD